MNTSLLIDQAPTVRTQISLTPSIKRAIEAKGRLLGESLSEYLRKAAVIRLLAQEDEVKDLQLVAKMFVGAGTWHKTHPNWKTKKDVALWRKQIREEWE